MKNKLKILLIEDDEDDYFFITHLAKKNDYLNLSITWAKSVEEGHNLTLNENFDVIMVDYYLGAKTAIDFLNLYKKKVKAPVIVLTGLNNREKDIEVMSHGADDYLPKETLNEHLLERSIRYAIERSNAKKKLARLLKKTNRQEKINVSGKMARVVAHEIRNPLTNINLSITEIESITNNDDQSIYIDMVKRNVNKINDIVTDFINSTKPVELELDTLDINQIIKQSIEFCEDQLSLKGITLKTDLNSTNTINIDLKKMPLVFNNLITNSIEALNDVEDCIITIETIDIKNGVKVIFTDNGCGMDEETQKNIFNSFYTNKVNGLGIGMSTIRNIISAHNGHIDIQSELNNGSTFTIYFE